MKTKKISITEEFVERRVVGYDAAARGRDGCRECGSPLVNLETFAVVLGVGLPAAFTAAVDGLEHYESTAAGDLRICVSSIRSMMGRPRLGGT